MKYFSLLKVQFEVIVLPKTATVTYMYSVYNTVGWPECSEGKPESICKIKIDKIPTLSNLAE